MSGVIKVNVAELISPHGVEKMQTELLIKYLNWQKNSYNPEMVLADNAASLHRQTGLSYVTCKNLVNLLKT